jgi:hypothetical protein
VTVKPNLSLRVNTEDLSALYNQAGSFIIPSPETVDGPGGKVRANQPMLASAAIARQERYAPHLSRGGCID